MGNGASSSSGKDLDNQSFSNNNNLEGNTNSAQKEGLIFSISLFASPSNLYSEIVKLLDQCLKSKEISTQQAYYLNFMKDYLYVNYYGYMRWREPEGFDSWWVRDFSSNESALLAQANYTDQMLFLCQVVENISKNTQDPEFDQLRLALDQHLEYKELKPIQENCNKTYSFYFTEHQVLRLSKINVNFPLPKVTVGLIKNIIDKKLEFFQTEKNPNFNFFSEIQQSKGSNNEKLTSKFNLVLNKKSSPNQYELDGTSAQESKELFQMLLVDHSGKVDTKGDEIASLLSHFQNKILRQYWVGQIVTEVINPHLATDKSNDQNYPEDNQAEGEYPEGEGANIIIENNNIISRYQNDSDENEYEAEGGYFEGEGEYPEGEGANIIIENNNIISRYQNDSDENEYEAEGGYFEGEGEYPDENEYEAEGGYFEGEDEYAESEYAEGEGEYAEGEHGKGSNDQSIIIETNNNNDKDHFEDFNLIFVPESEFNKENSANPYLFFFKKETKRNDRFYDVRFTEMQDWVQEQLKNNKDNKKLQKFSKELDFFHKKYQDPISLEIMQIPVILSSGKTLDKSSALDILNGNKLCPLTNEKLTDDKDKLTLNSDFKSNLIIDLENLEKKYDQLFSKFNPGNTSENNLTN